MNEARFWRYLKAKIPPAAHFQRHEDISASGIPDLSYAWNGVDGWIELKYYPKWKKQDFKHIDTWTKVQRHWLEKRTRAGNGRCFLFVKIGNEYLLFKMDKLFTDDFYHVSKKKLIHEAIGYWKDKINVWELEKILCCAE